MDSLDRILDEAMALPLNQQEMLMQVLQQRIIEQRDEIARDAQKSRSELKARTTEEAVDELKDFLDND
jgi:transcriptional regulator with AAA-type ATPase domain